MSGLKRIILTDIAEAYVKIKKRGFCASWATKTVLSVWWLIGKTWNDPQRAI
jgi:hypothetical protein